MKILIVKLSSLGDVLQTTPLIRSLSPQYKVYFLTYRQNAKLLENNPNISKLFILDPLEWDIFVPLLIVKNIFSLLKLVVMKINISVNLHKAYKLNKLFKLFGIRQRIGLVVNETDSHCLTDVIVFNQTEHHIHQYLKTADILKCKTLGYKMDFFPIKMDDKSQLRTNIDGPYIVIAPGGGRNRWASMPNKIWPANSYKNLCERILLNNTKVIFVGDLHDSTIVASILKNFNERGNIINLVSKLSINEISWIITKSSGFVGNDSFMLHFASTTGVQTLGLFGPTSGAILAPLGTEDNYIQSQVECSPCYDANMALSSQAYLCTDPACMNTIQVEEVFLHIQSKMIQIKSSQRSNNVKQLIK